jgi:hypothetical protein
MSAGDVKFIGWMGTSPSYQERSPSITYEPFRETRAVWATGSAVIDESLANFFETFSGNSIAVARAQFVRAKLTRRLICFTKDKDAVIRTLGYENVALNLIYIDDNGAIASKSYGAGWSLLTIDDSPISTGFSQITATFEKAQNKGVAIPGVDVQFDCTDGVCSIIYKGETVEEIDSGSTDCAGGYTFAYLNYPLTPLEPFRPDPRFANVVPGYIASEVNDPASYQSEVYFRAWIACGETVAELVELTGADVPNGTYKYKSTEDVSADLQDKTDAEIIAAYRALYTDAAFVTHDFAVGQYVDASGPTLVKTITVTRNYTLPSNPSLRLEWSESGDVLTLAIVGNGFRRVIKSYEVA